MKKTISMITILALLMTTSANAKRNTPVQKKSARTKQNKVTVPPRKRQRRSALPTQIEQTQPIILKKIPLLPTEAIKPSPLPAAPSMDAPPHEWYKWLTSLKTKSAHDIKQTKAYLNKKWDCIRSGQNCIGKERTTLIGLSTLVAGLAVTGAATALYFGKKRNTRPQQPNIGPQPPTEPATRAPKLPPRPIADLRDESFDTYIGQLGLWLNPVYHLNHGGYDLYLNSQTRKYYRNKGYTDAQRDAGTWEIWDNNTNQWKTTTKPRPLPVPGWVDGGDGYWYSNDKKWRSDGKNTYYKDTVSEEWTLHKK